MSILPPANALPSIIGSTKAVPIGYSGRSMGLNSAACGGGHEQRGNSGGIRSAYDCQTDRRSRSAESWDSPASARCCPETGVCDGTGGWAEICLFAGIIFFFKLSF